MGKKSAPASPDYAGAAEQTAAGNLQQLQYQTQANRPDVITPYGSSTWTNDGNNNWTNTVSLTPEMQASLDAQQAITNKQSQLASQLQGQVSDTMSQGFQAPNLNDYIGNTPQLSTNFSGFQGTGSSVNLGYTPFTSTAGSADTNFSGFNGSGHAVNLNAPQFSTADAQAASQAAYNSATSLLRPQMEQDTKNLDDQLRLQGLTPGSEAYNNAVQNLSRSQDAQLNQLANQAVLTGNNIANQNYASQLAGYNAGLTGQAQDYSQALSNYATGQSARAQQNAAQQQNFNQQMAEYGANQDAISNYNTAQNQQYNQAMQQYLTGQQATQNYNQAAQQQYQNALQNYQTAYTAANQQYYQPLNALNAVLNGNQVQMPQFQTPNSSAGYANGPDYLSAAQAQGNYNLAAAQQGGDFWSSLLGMAGQLGGAYLSNNKVSDIRLTVNDN